MINRIFPVVMIAMAISGCSRYGYVQLNYPSAPAAYLPDEVHAIAVVNRSLTSEEDEHDKRVEAITTGEVAGSDLLASDACIKGVFDGFRDFGQAELIIPRQVRMDGTSVYNNKVKSMNSNPLVLYVVDNKIVTDISYINPTYVRSIEFLEDANTTMYGSQGANGVLKIYLK